MSFLKSETEAINMIFPFFKNLRTFPEDAKLGLLLCLLSSQDSHAGVTNHLPTMFYCLRASKFKYYRSLMFGNQTGKWDIKLQILLYFSFYFLGILPRVNQIHNKDDFISNFIQNHGMFGHNTPSQIRVKCTPWI